MVDSTKRQNHEGGQSPGVSFVSNSITWLDIFGMKFMWPVRKQEYCRGRVIRLFVHG